MNVLTRLTLLRFRQYRTRTLLTFVAIVLASLMLTMVVGLVFSGREYLRGRYIAENGAHHVKIVNLTEEDVERMRAHGDVESVTAERNEEGLQTALVRLKHPSRFLTEQVDALLRAVSHNEKRNFSGSIRIEPHGPLLATERFFSDQTSLVSWEGAMALLLGVVGASSVIVISNAFYVSGDERAAEFAMLRSVGATDEQIRETVRNEAFMLGAPAIPLGIGLGMFGTWLALRIARGILPELDTLQPAFSGSATGLTVVVCFIVLYLSVRAPAQKAARRTPTEILRHRHSIRREKETPRPRKGARQRVESMLAMRFMRRQQRVYRATILSLVMAVVIFLGVSSIAQHLRELAVRTMDMGLAAAEVRVYPAPEAATDAALRERLQEKTGVPVQRAHRQPIVFEFADIHRLLYGDVEARAWEGKDIGRAVFVEEALWSELLMQADIDESGEYPALFVIDRQRYGEFYEVPTIEQPKVLSPAEEGVPDIAVIGNMYLEDTPKPWRGLFYDTVRGGSQLLLVMPERALSAFSGAQWAPTLVLFGDPNPVPPFLDEAERIAGEWGIGEEDLLFRNHQKDIERTRQMHVLVQFFAYGLVAMLSLIGITSVWHTMMTGIAMRKREFAVLISAGMTRDSLFRVLFFETLRMVGITLGIGIPLGIVVNWVSYLVLLNWSNARFYISPLQIIVVVAAVVGLAYVMLVYAHRTAYRLNPAPVLKRSAL